MKEFVEACPIIDAVLRLVVKTNDDDSDYNDEPYTIVDLACGKGYLSMLLSEMLPPAKVKRFLLIDKAWASHGTTPASHHMNWDHLYDPKYRDTWPIPLVASKQDLKSGRQRRNLEKHYLDGTSNVILLAVHLCGTLSLRAVDFFNQNAGIRFFCLKPCCLPGMVHAKRREIFELGGKNVNGSGLVYNKHRFAAESVCMHGKWKKNQWKGPHRNSLVTYFQTWADNLFLGIAATNAEVVRKIPTAAVDAAASSLSAVETITHCDDCNNGDNGNKNGAKKSKIKHDDDDDKTITTAQQHEHQQRQEEEEEGKEARCSPSTSSFLPAQKIKRTIMVQTDGGYQNEFLFAHRASSLASRNLLEKLLRHSV